MFAIVVTAIAVMGICVVVRSVLVGTTPWRSSARMNGALLLAMAAGTAATIVTSATESRFALLLVLVGVIGCIQIVEDRNKVQPRAVAVCALAVAVVVALGYWGLSNPAIPGGVTAPICSLT